MLLLLTLLIASCGVGYGFRADKIVSLPGLNFPINFNMYSGYLNASDGKQLHYWFVESMNNASAAPLVLWMNGGPGCSSMAGFLTEQGPFRVMTDGKTLKPNPYAWNSVANIIFLEAPAGVGYSYSPSQDYTTDDDVTSLDNYLALQHFFKKFPNYSGRDFYITGESYAGIYVPTLSVRVLRGGSAINFKGFAIGNGYLDTVKLPNSLVFFAYYHGLIGQEMWDLARKYCCNGTYTRKNCEFANTGSSQCQLIVSKILNVVQSSGLNIYNLYDDCVVNTANVNGRSNTRQQVDRRTLLKTFPFYHNAMDSSIPCEDDSNITYYMNQQSVRQALHIPSFVQSWEVCSTDVESRYTTLYKTMQPQIHELIDSRKLRGLIYNGDVDMACNFLGDEWFFTDLGYPVTKKYKPWKVQNQIAGFSKSYTNLTYTTIRGSGHMVPEDKPMVSLKMISNFLKNLSL